MFQTSSYIVLIFLHFPFYIYNFFLFCFNFSSFPILYFIFFLSYLIIFLVTIIILKIIIMYLSCFNDTSFPFTHTPPLIFLKMFVFNKKISSFSTSLLFRSLIFLFSKFHYLFLLILFFFTNIFH